MIESFRLPIGILLWNTNDLLAKSFEPFVRLFVLLCEPCLDCVRTIRRSPSKSQHEEQQSGFGDQKRSTMICV